MGETVAQPMRHAILGAGGVGGLMAACLAHAGDSVTLVVRGESAAEYPRQIRLESGFGNFSAEVAVSAEVPAVDALWLTVKATQLDAALGAITNAGAVKAMVPLLNGIDHIAGLRSRYGAERVIPATIAVESERVSPGHIVHRSPFARLNVSSQGKGPLAGALDRLQSVGFECRFIDSEATLMWGKLVFLAPFALATTAANRTVGEILSDPTWRSLGEDCVREACAIALAEGAAVDADQVLAGVAAMPGGMRSSMMKDVAAHKIPELDAIAGPILRGARQFGIKIPATEKLVAAVRERSAFPAK